MKKGVNYFVQDVKSFLQSNNIYPDKICVIGMSMGEMDIPYLVQAHKLYPGVEWIVSYQMILMEAIRMLFTIMSRQKLARCICRQYWLC